jgi:hypothetical protein
MKRVWLGAFISCLAVVAVMGCKGGAQIYQVKEAPIQTATGKVPSVEQVQKIIIESGVKLGWVMAVVKPGEIQGTRNVRVHSAVVTIPFTAKNYSVLYKDSTNLKYNAAAQTIHQEYTYWIQELDNEIRARLTAAGN